MSGNGVNQDLASGQSPFVDLPPGSIEISDALDAAHAKGIGHQARETCAPSDPTRGSVAAEAVRAGIARIGVRQKRLNVRQPISHGNEWQLVARDLPVIGSNQVGRLLQCHH
jgi:hypothetical protein